MNHVDDDAELYALGLTERERDAEIEAHIASCAACRARVVAAEAAAAALAAALLPMPAAAPTRRSRTSWLAVAAALALAATAAFEGIAAHAAGTQLARTDLALSTIAASHFNHTTLTSDRGVVAKALYAHDGSWCFVVVNHAPRGARVLLRRGAATVDAGALQSGDPATLFIAHPGKADEISVTSETQTIAHAKPAY